MDEGQGVFNTYTSPPCPENSKGDGHWIDVFDLWSGTIHSGYYHTGRGNSMVGLT